MEETTEMIEERAIKEDEDDAAPSAEETELFETDESAATPPPHLHIVYSEDFRVQLSTYTFGLMQGFQLSLAIYSTIITSPPMVSPRPGYRLHQLPPLPSQSQPLSPPSPVHLPAPPPSPIRSLGYQAAMIRLRAEAASTSHSLPLPPPFILSPTRSDAPSSGIPPPLPISVPTSSPPLLTPSASRRECNI
ncbi:hypothetical protein Tco_1375830 [Tanacetum coccineum]